MYARNGAMRSAAFFGEKLPANVGDRVLLQRNAGIATLLRAVVHQTVLANVKVTGARPAAPVIGLAIGNVVLEPVKAGVMVLLQVLHLQKDLALVFTQRLKLSISIVNDADGGGESQLHGAAPHDQRVVRVVDATTNDRIDVDVEVSMLSQQLQFLVEHLQRLFGDIVGHHIVHADLQV